mmetsp:Transcript_9285/g.8737  ORF Transcript_9285/g.8737 Transcript_9285/m.8737 type:complete len:231 (-) Transcript_9285:697-1389(-)
MLISWGYFQQTRPITSTILSSSSCLSFTLISKSFPNCFSPFSSSSLVWSVSWWACFKAAWSSLLVSSCSLYESSIFSILIWIFLLSFSNWFWSLSKLATSVSSTLLESRSWSWFWARLSWSICLRFSSKSPFVSFFRPSSFSSSSSLFWYCWEPWTLSRVELSLARLSNSLCLSFSTFNKSINSCIRFCSRSYVALSFSISAHECCRFDTSILCLSRTSSLEFSSSRSSS